MTIAANIDASKTEHGENFPVASVADRARAARADLELLPLRPRRRRHRGPSDACRESRNSRALTARSDTLLGRIGCGQEGAAIAARARGDRTSADTPARSAPAFRADVTKRRYANWDELMDYCRYSAMPVGRFVLDLHGEDRSIWAYSDPLCSALQVINHLQDCAKDYCELDRVYLPLDILAAHGTDVGGCWTRGRRLPCVAALRSIAGKTANSCRKPRNCRLPSGYASRS